MKKKWIESLGHADDRFIEEADPTKMVKRKSHSRRVWLTLTSCACLAALLVGSFGVYHHFFGKEGAPVRYSNSDYHFLIEKLRAMEQNRKENTATNDSGDSGADDSTNGERYEEITDNQVANVIEGDVIKRSDRYVYYLSGNVLLVYSIEGTKSKRVGRVALPYVADTKMQYYFENSELFLSEDCKTVTAIRPYCDHRLKTSEFKVLITQVDVGDISDMKVVRSATLDGWYNDARLIDGNLLITTTYFLEFESVDYNDPETFVPHIEDAQGKKAVSSDRIVLPEEPTSDVYRVVASFDADALLLSDALALLSHSMPYVAEENVYVPFSYVKIKKDADIVQTQSYTDITRFVYQDGLFTQKDTVTVEGVVMYRYNMDEYNDVLRVVTTTVIREYRADRWEKDTSARAAFASHTNANLYCIDLLDDMKVISKVVGFAPDGETVQSVRYKGDAAYVCTAVVVSFLDPVFFFDLSDPANITYAETQTMEGYSSFLVDFENGNLLGMGYLDQDTMKLEVYREEGGNIVSVCKYQSEQTGFASDSKAYFIDREKQIVGLGVFTREGKRYLVLHFDGNTLAPIIQKNFIGNGPYDMVSRMRGFYKDGCYYMFSGNNFAVEELHLG